MFNMCLYIYAVACLMPRLLDRMCEAQTLHTKYEVRPV